MTTRRKAKPLRRCTGSTTFGIEAHEAPVADFPVQPSRKDGLGTMCREHWTLYTRSLRQVQRARQAAGGTMPAFAEPAAPTRSSNELRDARRLIARVDRLDGTAYLDAVAGDAVQEALRTLSRAKDGPEVHERLAAKRRAIIDTEADAA